MKALWLLLGTAATPRLEPAPASGLDPRQQASAPSVGTPFDALLPFVPRGMESVMFIDYSNEGLPEHLRPRSGGGGSDPLDELRNGAPSLRGIHAGRRFTMRGVGGGDFEGVEIYESGKDLPDLAGLVRKWPDWKEEIVAGHKAYSAPPNEEGPIEKWIAAPSKRLRLVATRRGILEESLRRQGARSDGLFRDLGWRQPADWTSPIVIVRRYDPTNEADAYSPLNTKAKGFAPLTRGFKIEGLLLQYLPGDPPGFRAWVKTEDPESSRRYFAELLNPRTDWRLRADPLPSSPSAPGEILLEGKFPDHVRSFPGIPLLQAFGLNIFI